MPEGAPTARVPHPSHKLPREVWNTRILCLILLHVTILSGCRSTPRDPQTLVFLIEASPTSLDPRIGTDGQSEHLDELMFDGLVARDASFHFVPALAERWEEPDPRTVIFHLRSGVHFHDGRPLTAKDVIFSIQSMRDGTVISPKTASYASIATIDAPDPQTVIFHLKQPDNFLLTNLSTGALGVIPAGSGREFWRHPIGTGPFRFVSQQIDQDVVLERNPSSWSIVPKIPRVRFSVVPDAITQSLELEKGSGDVSINFLPMDALPVLAKRSNLTIDSVPGTPIQYLAFNLRDPLLKDVHVRQAISCAIDRNLMIRTLLGGHARPAQSLLPPGHWAYSDAGPHFDYDPARARRILDDAGYHASKNGIRLRLTMKSSSAEETRILSAVLQQQLAQVGIALDIRTYEFATFYSDVTRGAFQLYSMRWIGGNEQPEIFNYTLSTARFSPKGANRGHYSNAQVDALLDDAATNPDQNQRRNDYVQVQRILAEEVPVIDLWYRDTVVVHNRRVTHVVPNASGGFTFLESADLAP